MARNFIIVWLILALELVVTVRQVAKPHGYCESPEEASVWMSLVPALALNFGVGLICLATVTISII